MSHWRQSSIGELCEQGLIALQTGPFGSQLHAHDYVPCGIPVVPTEALRARRINHSVLPKITAEKAKTLERHRLKPGDILFARRGAQATGHIGFVRKQEEGFLCGTGAIRLRVIDAQSHNVLSEFLSHVFADAASIGWFKFHAIGATMPNLNEGIIRSFPLMLPPSEDQKAIAHFLTALDDKIELNWRISDTLEAIARVIFKSWFVDYDLVRAKGSTFEDSKLGQAPCGWRVTELDEIAEVIDCLHSKKPDRQLGGSPFLQLSNIRDDGLLDMTDTYLISEQDYRLWTSRMEAREGDCVITNVGRVAAVAQIPAGVKAALGRNMTGLRCRNGHHHPTFLLQLLLSESMKEEIGLKIDSGTILDSLNVRSIPLLRFVLPPTPLIEEFERMCRPLRAKMEANFVESRTLTTIRDALLPKLISGELRLRQAEKIVEAHV